MHAAQAGAAYGSRVGLQMTLYKRREKMLLQRQYQQKIFFRFAYLEVEVSVEHLAADVATEPLHAAVYFYVLIKVGSLCEAKSTVIVRTNIGSLIGVNSQMVKEVVPFSEPFVAALVVALQDLDVTLTPRVLVSKNPELLGGWHMLLDLDAS